MNGSKPYGTSAVQQSSGESSARLAHRTSTCPSPRPSPSERGRKLRLHWVPPSAVWPMNLPNIHNCRRSFPLPEGEGEGEGNLVALRQSELDHSRNCRTSPVLR